METEILDMFCQQKLLDFWSQSPAKKDKNPFFDMHGMFDLKANYESHSC